MIIPITVPLDEKYVSNALQKAWELGYAAGYDQARDEETYTEEPLPPPVNPFGAP